jgi:hypothetical protein
VSEKKLPLQGDLTIHTQSAVSESETKEEEAARLKHSERLEKLIWATKKVKYAGNVQVAKGLCQKFIDHN